MRELLNLAFEALLNDLHTTLQALLLTLATPRLEDSAQVDDLSHAVRVGFPPSFL